MEEINKNNRYKEELNSSLNISYHIRNKSACIKNIKYEKVR